MAKKQSRAARWSEACSQASSAIQTLVDLQQEFSDWKDNLPENLSSSTLGEKLEAVCDIDLDGAQQSIEEAENAELPLGFGRD